MGGSSRFWSWNITSMCCGGKPGALAGSTALDQQRQAGQWPASFDRIWQALMARHGKQSGTRQMVGLLKRGQQYGRGKLQEAVEAALGAGCSDAPAVEHLLRQDELRRCGCEAVEVGVLERYARPLPVMAAQFSRVAEQAVREKKSHTGYLEVLLQAEIEERERNTIERRIYHG